MSVIDGRRFTLKEAFSWIIHYYDPNKKKNVRSRVLDSTCSVMLSWNQTDLHYFDVITNDIREGIKADYHYDCSQICFEKPEWDHTFDIIYYDPPYIDLKNRKDSKKYEEAFNYEAIKTPKQLETLTFHSFACFDSLLKKDGIVIVKITNFHYKGRLYGTYNIRDYCKPYFYLFDETLYRFYRKVNDINWYSIKAVKTHTFFMIFKKEK